jgi:hypothetical protein
LQGQAALPACITLDRAAALTGNQVIANRFVLYDRLTELALRAVRSYVAPEDAPSVAQAISELMIKQAETTDSLVEVLARKLPILHHVGVEWPYMAVSILSHRFATCSYRFEISVALSELCYTWNISGIHGMHYLVCSIGTKAPK